MICAPHRHFAAIVLIIFSVSLASALSLKPATFSQPVTYASGGFYAASLAIADLKGDGQLDLVVANSCAIDVDGGSDCEAGGTVAVLLANGDGTFQQSVTYGSGGMAAASVAIADVNNDGIPDLLVVNQCASQSDCSNGTVGVLLGNGDGTFQPVIAYSAGNNPDSIAIGDLNGDGYADLVVANQCLSANSCNTGAVTVLLGAGNGSFPSAVSYASSGQKGLSVAINDFNGDGIPDVVVANQCLSKSNCNLGGVSVLLGNGNGSLGAATGYSSGAYSATSVTTADVNGDGDPDIIVTSLCSDGTNCINSVVAVLLNKGNGTFKTATTYTGSAYGASSVAYSDVTGDGIPDLVVDDICKTSTNCSKGAISIFPGNGDGTFQNAVQYSSDGYDPVSVAIADLNADGRSDVVTTNYCASQSDCSGTVAVLLNNSQAKTKTVLASSPNPSEVGQAVVLTATVTSTPSVPDGEIVTFSQGKTVLGTGATNNGIATLSATFSAVGTFTIKAAYPGDAFHKASSGKVKQVVTQ